MSKYTIGIDYGTLSGRAVVVDVTTGEELAAAVMEYPHGVMETALPDGTPLPPQWALQHPQDYLDVLYAIVPQALAASGISPQDVIGIGVDFTACTVLPVRADGMPLCLEEKYAGRPHAWVKLWKHHGAQAQADRITALGAEYPGLLAGFGGKASCEWMFPKLMELLEQDPALAADADRIIEAGDWLVWLLCGNEVRSMCLAGYKALWSAETGYPAPEILGKMHPQLPQLVAEKMTAPMLPITGCAGGLTEPMAAALGLLPGTPVAAANIDAHSAIPACGVSRPHDMVMIMGTSSCHHVMSAGQHAIPGLFGIVKDGVLPGYYAYEAGQSCCGDHFDWAVKNIAPESYAQEARSRGISLHQLMQEKCAGRRPGENGLLALDWYNGNRSILNDSRLTGMILGLTLSTRPEDIYRALVEATAYGTRTIIEAIEAGGVPVQGLFACGGLAQKSPMLMQIYADVTGREIRIAASRQASALGAAIHAAVAAGSERGGYDSAAEAGAHMARLLDTVYRPNAENKAIYDRLYAEYRTLHDYFGRGENDVMKRLMALRG